MREERDRAKGYLDVAGVMILVLDRDRKVCLINQKGCELLGCVEDEIVGKDWLESFVPQRFRGEVALVFSKMISGVRGPLDYFENPVLTKGGQERVIGWRNSLLRDAKGNVIGVLSSGEDITDRRRAEAERERLIRQLEDALSQVKMLKGILPICASCKRIRDDKGDWIQIEEYMKEHAEVEFSHGICPECRVRLYPEFSEDHDGRPAKRNQ